MLCLVVMQTLTLGLVRGGSRYAVSGGNVNPNLNYLVDACKRINHVNSPQPNSVPLLLASSEPEVNISCQLQNPDSDSTYNPIPIPIPIAIPIHLSMSISTMPNHSRTRAVTPGGPSFVLCLEA